MLQNTHLKIQSLLLIILIISFAGCNGSKNKTSTETENNLTISDTLPWSVRMAESDIIRNPEAWMLDFSTKPRWNYCQGLVCLAIQQVYEKYGDENLYQYVKAYADTMIDENGNIRDYKLENYNIDQVNPGKILFSLYKKTGDERYKKAIYTLREQMKTHPRTSEGGFWHKKRYPHQMWLDGLYMGTPFLAQFAKEFNEPELFNDVANQIYLIDKYTRNDKTGLFHHGWDESRGQQWADGITGKSPNIWGRGMGWLAMALVDVLDFFPENHPKRPMIIDITNHMANVLVKYQDEKTGLWYQVVDSIGTEGNYLESTASSMFIYFLKKSIQHNYIPKEKFEQPMLKAYKGLFENLIEVEKDGVVNIIKCCAGAGLGGHPYRSGTYEYYINEHVRANDPKAVGPFIMLSLLFENKNENK